MGKESRSLSLHQGGQSVTPEGATQGSEALVLCHSSPEQSVTRGVSRREGARGQTLLSPQSKPNDDRAPCGGPKQEAGAGGTVAPLLGSWLWGTLLRRTPLGGLT